MITLLLGPGGMLRQQQEQAWRRASSSEATAGLRMGTWHAARVNEAAWGPEDKSARRRLETESTEARAASGDRRAVLPSLQRRNRGCQSRSDYCFLWLVSSAVFCVLLILARAPVRVRTFFPVQAGTLCGLC